MSWLRTPAGKGVVVTLGYAAGLVAVVGVTTLIHKLGEATSPWIGWALLIAFLTVPFGLLTWHTERSKQRRKVTKEDVRS